jgi:RimJ/RimL family protein N-acetyltransferase
MAPPPDDILSPRLMLRPLGPKVLDAVIAGDLDAAAIILGMPVPETWPGDAADAFEHHRRRLAEEPEAWRPWSMHAVVLRGSRRVIGHAGYHGPPGANALDDTDAVEIGYTIEEAYRGAGYATEAARALIEEAFARGVSRVLASIAPDNAPSRAVVANLGFRYVTTVTEGGEMEIVYERRPWGGQ